MSDMREYNESAAKEQENRVAVDSNWTCDATGPITAIRNSAGEKIADANYKYAPLIVAAPELLAAISDLVAAAGHDETLQGGERIGKRDDARLSAARLNGAIVNAKALLSKVRS